MSTQIAQTETAAQISAAQAQANAIATSATSAVSGNTFVFFAAFDGTNNIKTNPEYSGDTQSTAVGELSDQVAAASNIPGSNVQVGYYPGVGTPGTAFASSIFPTQQAIATAQSAYNDFAAAAANWLTDNPGGSVTTMLTSFSRGSVAAAIFSQMLYENGLVDPNTGTTLIPPGQVGVSAGLVISPVDTGATGNLAFAPNVQNMTVVLADNEYRTLYEQATYNQPGFTTLGMTGNHGDVGSLYDSGLGGLALQAYQGFFNNAGLSIAPVLPSREFNPDAPVVIHVETYDIQNPQNLFSYGSVADNTPLRTVTITPSEASTGPTVDYTINSDGSQTYYLQIPGTTLTTTIPAEVTPPDQFAVGTVLDTTLNVFSQFENVTNENQNTLPPGQEVVIIGSNGYDVTIDPAGTVDIIDDGTGSGDGDPVIQVDGTPPFSFAHDGDLKIVAGNGNDSVDLRGSTGNNTVLAGNGNDSIWGGSLGSNVILAGDGNDSILAINSGSNIIKVGNGNDTIGASGLNNTIVAGGGLDAITTGLGNNSIIVGANLAPWTLVTFPGLYDMIVLGDGNNTFDGGGSRDHITFGLGNNIIIGGSGLGGNVIGPHSVLGYTPESLAAAGDDFIIGGPNGNLIGGGFGNNTIYGGAGDDTIFAGGSPVVGGVNFPGIRGHHNVVFGGDGNDVLEAGYGNDTLDGGPGDDTLMMGRGNGTFVFGLGSGHDLIQPRGVPATSTDTIQLGAGITPSDVTLQADASGDVTLQIQGSSDQLTVNFFLYSPFTDFLYSPFDNPVLYNGDDIMGEGQIAFADGTVWNKAMITSQVQGLTLTGTDGPDTLQGTFVNDTLIGGPGNDTLVGDSGNDTYVFGRGDGQDTIIDQNYSGSDTSDMNTIRLGADVAPTDVILTTDSAEDLVLAIAGTTDQLTVANYFVDPGYEVEQVQFADGAVWDTSAIFSRVQGITITGTEDSDFLQGSPFNDVLTGLGGDDELDGLAGADTLIGGTGNDVLVGGTGNDTYVFNIGDGFDTIYDTAAPGAGNVIQFGAGITAGDLIFTQDQTEHTLTIVYDDAVQLVGFDPNGVHGTLVVSTLKFSDGSSLNMADLFPPTTPTNHAPTVANPIADQSTLEDSALSFQVPANTFADQDAGDTLTLSATLTNGNPLPVWLSFDAATRTFSGTPDDPDIGTINVKLTATDSGNLSVADTFGLTVTPVNEAPTVANAIADQSTEADSPFSFTVPGNTFTDQDVGDTLAYSAALAGGGALPSWLNFNAATRTFSGTPGDGDVGNLSLQVTATDSGGLSAADAFGFTIAPAPVHVINGTDGDDVISGTAGDDVIDAKDGNDIVNAGRGNDLVEGGAGNDILRGEAGNDTLSGGTGSDLLDGGPGDDVLQMSVDGIWTSDFIAYNAGSPGHPGTGQIVPIAGMNRSFDVFVGGDGTDSIIGTSGNDAIALDDLYSPFPQEPGPRIAGVEVIRTGDGNDLVDLTSFDFDYGDVTLDGENGNDTLWASSGNDVLIGGPGNDSLVGGAGNDTYLFNRGDGQDTIIDHDATPGNRDTVAFGSDLVPSDFVLSRQANDLRIAIHGSSDQITVQDWYNGPDNQTEVIQASNGQQLLNTQVDQLIQAMAQFSADNGLTWDQAIDQRPQDVQTILAANWH